MTAPERGDLHPVGAVATRSADGAAVPSSVGQEEPARGVEHDAGAAREREHDEREPHEVRLDVEVVADPAGDTGDELVVTGG